METRGFGKTGLEVSALGFGGAPVGFLETDRRQVTEILNTLLDRGVNLIDTAASYRGSEEAIGEAIGHRRDDYVLVSKCGQALDDIEGAAWSPLLIERTVERALRRLKTDQIDVMLLHSCDLEVLQEGAALGALVKAREAGKVRFVGYSGDNEAAVHAAGLDEVAVNRNLHQPVRPGQHRHRAPPGPAQQYRCSGQAADCQRGLEGRLRATRHLRQLRQNLCRAPGQDGDHAGRPGVPRRGWGGLVRDRVALYRVAARASPRQSSARQTRRTSNATSRPWRRAPWRRRSWPLCARRSAAPRPPPASRGWPRRRDRKSRFGQRCRRRREPSSSNDARHLCARSQSCWHSPPGHKDSAAGRPKPARPVAENPRAPRAPSPPRADPSAAPVARRRDKANCCACREAGHRKVVRKGAAADERAPTSWPATRAPRTVTSKVPDTQQGSCFNTNARVPCPTEGTPVLWPRRQLWGSRT